MKFLYWFATIIICFSCAEAPKTTDKKFFDLNEIIQHQIEQLSKVKPFVKKNIAINDQKESIRTNQIDWQKELELLNQADLNKQAYQQSYDEQKSDTLIIYQLKEGENLPVKSLIISLDKKKKPKKMEALMGVKNYLYESEKRISMELENERLIRYEIRAWQELFIGKRKFFNIISEIE